MEIDITGLTYKDIDPGVRNGHAIETGKIKNPNGTWSRITRYEEYYKTRWGNLTLDEWTELAERVIEAHGDGQLYAAIIEKVRSRAWNKNAKEKDIRHDAAKCLVWGSWKAWEDRGEFTPPELSFSQLLRINSEEG